MNRRLILMAFAAGTLAAFVADAQPLPFGPGERIGMEVRYLGMHVGEFEITVAEDDAARNGTAWPITLEGRTRGLFDSLHSVREHFVSHFDPVERRATGSNERSKAGDDHTVQAIRIIGTKALVDRTLNGRNTRRVKPVPAGVHDILSAIYHLRGAPLAEGLKLDLPVFSSKKSWTMKARVTGRERVETDLGTFDAWVVRCRTHMDGKLATDREVVMWITADERRLLARVEADVAIGSLKVGLVSYTAPTARPAGRITQPATHQAAP